MKILITGGSGFVGSNIAIYLKKNLKGVKIYSLDNLSRKGSTINKKELSVLDSTKFTTTNGVLVNGYRIMK